MTSRQSNGGPRGASVHIYNPQWWILKLTNGTTLLGHVNDDSHDMVVLDHPKVLHTPKPLFDNNNYSLDTRFYQAEDRIYIERTAIAYWAKPNDNAIGI